MTTDLPLPTLNFEQLRADLGITQPAEEQQAQQQTQSSTTLLKPPRPSRAPSAVLGGNPLQILGAAPTPIGDMAVNTDAVSNAQGGRELIVSVERGWAIEDTERAAYLQHFSQLDTGNIA
jgi:hypothetical protein